MYFLLENNYINSKKRFLTWECTVYENKCTKVKVPAGKDTVGSK